MRFDIHQLRARTAAAAIDPKLAPTKEISFLRINGQSFYWQPGELNKKNANEFFHDELMRFGRKRAFLNWGCQRPHFGRYQRLSCARPEAGSMLSSQPDTAEGINSGAGFRLPGPLGMCGDHGAAGELGRPRAPFDPAACDHRHHFRRWGSVRRDQGFDNGTVRRSQWQLVPLGETREVELLWDRLFEKLVFSEHAHVASVDRSGDRYTISGLSAGDTALHAANSRGICRSELEITVRRPMQIPVVFHYLQDNRHKVSRPAGSGGKLLLRVNEIMAPQTAISFVEQANRSPDFKIDADLGDFVDPHAADVKHWCKERMVQLQSFGQVNVFFVWRVAGVGGDTTGAEMLDNLTCFVGDITKKDAGRILAHEFGHCLTRFDRDELYHDGEGHSTDEEYLMERFASGTRISREEADVMYKTAADSGGALGSG